MSNAAYLVANNSPRPAGSDTGYDPETDAIADAPMAVPVFWLALFGPAQVVTFESRADDGRPLSVPSLVGKRSDALRLLRDRRGVLLDLFPEFGPTWHRFADCLAGLRRRYLKVDLEELWDMVPGEFGPQLDAALRWFDSGDATALRNLLELAGIDDYDPGRRTFPGREGVPRAFHFRGYPCSLANWEVEDDI
jgi:hypothetical protein